jgi:FkbM family methyltransferase
MRDNLEKILSVVQPYDLDDHTVVVFGAGSTSVLYQKCFELDGIHPVYYVDNSEAKQGTAFQGVPVISVEKLVSLRETFGKPLLVLICSGQIAVCDQIRLQLQSHGLDYTTVDAFVFKKNAEEIKTVCDLLEDDFSKDVYTRLIESRINNTPVPESSVSNEQYFLLPQFIEHSAREIFVDLGAYVGDTVEQYINKKSGIFGGIYAFEPDAVNFSALKHRAARLKNEWAFSDNKLTLVNGGVGSVSEQRYLSAPPPAVAGTDETAFDSARLGANFVTDRNEGAATVTVYALDDYFKERRVNFIKADIESYELDMLHGARSVIKRDRPKLAVSIYHGASDMFTIPLCVRELCDDYKFKIRHHKYQYDDTVLYAYM